MVRLLFSEPKGVQKKKDVTRYRHNMSWNSSSTNVSFGAAFDRIRRIADLRELFVVDPRHRTGTFGDGDLGHVQRFPVGRGAVGYLEVQH